MNNLLSLSAVMTTQAIFNSTAGTDKVPTAHVSYCFAACSFLHCLCWWRTLLSTCYMRTSGTSLELEGVLRHLSAWRKQKGEAAGKSKNTAPLHSSWSKHSPFIIIGP